jgi:sarcosine oxidase subunit alpha
MRRQRHRLAEGGRIERDRPIAFSFNGKTYQGHPGDTLASALLANGVRLVARSFKYHRPRGIVGAGVEEPNAFVQRGRGAQAEPNVRATQLELFDGLEAASVNCWPSVRRDFWSINDRLSAPMPAGFYYKTFMWPPGLWMTYERVIRRAGGLGTAPDGPDPDIYDKRHSHCDVFVAGGGPAGLAAALAAARAGARVVLADEQAELGGAVLGNGERIAGAPATDWVAATVAELEALPEVRLLPRTTVFGYYDHNYMALVERVSDHLGPTAPAGQPRQRVWKVRAKQVVLATGAIERPIVFADNDRPGIMLASAAQSYVNRYGVRPGNRAVVFTTNDSAYRVAFDLATAGIDIRAVIDARPNPPEALVEAVRERGIELLSGQAVVSAGGSRHLRRVEVVALTERGDGLEGDARRIRCDLLCLSGGWSPAVHLLSQIGGKLAYDETLVCFVPGEIRQAARAAGAANGAFALGTCLAQGFAAGAEAARDAGFAEATPPAPPETEAAEGAPQRALWRVPTGGARGKCFVDLHTDVTAADIALAAREGYQAVEHLKRYTAAGMGPDQGKTGGINALAILSEIRDAAIPAVGTTTFRPPYTPVTYGALAGRDVGELADVARKTPIHAWHERAGAPFEDVGQWKRAWYYPRSGEDMHAAVARECRATRNSVGICDASTLGKIDIQGADALRLLNWVYTNAWDSLPIGRCRYGLMLSEDGMVLDDGVTARLGEQHYLMTTTSGGAARVMAWLEEWLQCEWPELKVYLTSVTTQWATVSVAGPNARRLLGEVATELDLSPEAFPHMAVREGVVAGIPARIFRVSFTGELAYEINVPASYGMALWQALMRGGESFEITPFGTEALHVLRAEKGYIAVGHDTDGSVSPFDLGFDWLVSKKKADFLGKRSLTRNDTARPDRKQLVGLLTEDPATVLPEGAHVVTEVKRKPPMPMIGHVTSSYSSAVLERSIALALIENGRARIGETVSVPLPLAGGRVVRAEVTKPIFFDPEGARLHG